MSSSAIGFMTFSLLGPGYVSAGIAMVMAITLMIVFDAMHPPAVSTALSFGLKASDENNLVLFGLAVAITAALVLLQRVSVWIVRPKNGPHA
jgi:CBS-domain-containing membrane protein